MKRGGEPETVRHSPEWQITTWLTDDRGWIVRVDGPEDRFWETDRLASRSEARDKGTEIVKGFISHAR